MFEVTDTNASMINESIIGFYLSKAFNLPKEKFRFLTVDYFVKEGQESQVENFRKVEPISMVAYTIEIAEDRDNIKTKMLTVRAAIRDSSSLLYDLLPAYMSMNLGDSGLATRHNMEDFHILFKRGQ